MKSLTELVRSLSDNYKILEDQLHIIDHQDIASYKPQLETWVQEILKRLHQPEVGGEDRESIKNKIIELVNKL